jgi:predicted transcriptional regulator
MTDTTLAGATTAPAGGRRTDADLAASLLTTIRAHGGEWTTARAAHHLNSINRHRARKTLNRLADQGWLIRHQRDNRRYFTLNHAKDHA